MASSDVIVPGFKYKDQCQRVGAAMEKMYKKKFPAFFDAGSPNFTCLKLEDNWFDIGG